MILMIKSDYKETLVVALDETCTQNRMCCSPCSLRSPVSLVGYADRVYQVGVFERELSKHYYYSAVFEGPARATVCTWEETEKWLKEEAANKTTAEEERKREMPQVSGIEVSSKSFLKRNGPISTIMCCTIKKFGNL